MAPLHGLPSLDHRVPEQQSGFGGPDHKPGGSRFQWPWGLAGLNQGPLRCIRCCNIERRRPGDTEPQQISHASNSSIPCAVRCPLSTSTAAVHLGPRPSPARATLTSGDTEIELIATYATFRQQLREPFV